ncbi:MAG: uroporphyrinogen decarboxylase family protein [Anaerolineales bacterium]|nr:uroporphyrinogen decarboxylase family protein [Anaerolineales bacterium]
MSAKERVFAAFNRQVPDRVPVMLIAYSHGAHLIGKKVGDLRNLENALASLMALYEHYKVDLITPSFGCKYWLYGDLDIEMQLPEDGYDSVAKPYFETLEEIVTKPLPDPRDPSSLLHNQIRLVEAACEQAGDRVVISAYGGSALGRACDLVGVDNLMRWFIRKPELADLVIKRTAEWTLEIARASLDAGAQVLGLTDPAAGGSMISTRYFERFALPVLKWMVNEIKAYKDVPIYLHICGHVEDRLDLMAETGVDAFSVDQLVSLELAKEAVGDRVCLIGNVDPVATLLLGTPETVLEEARACIRDAGKDGGFILAPGCGVPPRAPQENLRMLKKAVEIDGWYA